VKWLLPFFLSVLLLFTVFASTPVAEAQTDWYTGWGYRKKITIDCTKVAGDLTDFPVLISFTDSDLASKAQPDGDDILFTDGDGVTKLDHEIEYYDGATGELVAWVRVPSLSSTVDTEIYMYYGNPDALNQENSAGVWSNGYVAVWHLDETSGTVYDSTANNYDGTPYGGVTQDAVGKVDGADSFDGTDGHVDCGDIDAAEGIDAITIAFWVKTSMVLASGQRGLVTKDDLGTQRSWAVLFDNKIRWNPIGTVLGAQGVTEVNDGVWHYVVCTYDRYSGDGQQTKI